MKLAFFSHSGVKTHFYLFLTLCLFSAPLWAETNMLADTLFNEESERLARNWEMRMTPEEYRMAIDSTGAGSVDSVAQMEEGTAGRGSSLLYWTPLGPVGKLGTEETNGRISGIYIRSTGGGTYDVYAGACSGGLWRSSDLSASWVNVGRNLPNPSVRAFAVHPDDPNEILVGTGDYTRYGGSGLYRSTDGGSSWSWMELLRDCDHFHRVYYVPDKPDTILVANGIALFRSLDAGATWSVILNGPVMDLVINPSNSDIQYACSRFGAGGIYKTDNCWDDWVLLGGGAPRGTDLPGFGRSCVAVCRDYPDNVAVLATEGNDFELRGVYLSTDGGTTWNNIYRHWSYPGSGMDNAVLALTVHNNQLIAAGDFASADGGTANHIATWDGIAWSALGSGMNGSIYALAVYEDMLVAAGDFTTAGGGSADYIASWNGISWTTLGPGMNGPVNALTVYDNKLIAGGSFTIAGSSGVDHVASWDGSEWAALGLGTNGSVNALTVFDNHLIAGGEFTTAGGSSADHIASWDGSSWMALDVGMNASVNALTAYENELIAGGEFTTAGGNSAAYIASWDGAAWTALGSGMNGDVNALIAYGSRLIAGGDFTTAGGSGANFLAAWVDDVWSPLGPGMDQGVAALAVYDEYPVAGGWFTASGENSVNRIAAWLLQGNFGWGQLLHAQAIAINPSDPERIYVGGGTVLQTLDGGLHWEELAGGSIGHPDITQLYFGPDDDNTLWICNDGGLFGHDFTSGITSSRNGTPGMGINCLQMDYMDAQWGYRAAGMQDNGIVASSNGGINWWHHGSSDGGEIEITSYGAQPTGWLFVDGVSPIPPPWHISYKTFGVEDEVDIFGPDQYMPNLFFDRYSGLIYSSDDNYLYLSSFLVSGSHTWTPILPLKPVDRVKRGLYGDYVNGKSIFVTYWDSNILSVCKEVGGVWSSTEYSLPNNVLTVEASPQNTRECWAGLQGPTGPPGSIGVEKVLHTEDNWNTWRDITEKLSWVKSVFVIAVTPFNRDQLFAGTDIGVFRTTDGGTTWEPFNDGMPIVRCSDMRYLIDSTHTGNDRLVVSTYGNGMWERIIQGPPIIFVDKRNDTGIENGTLEFPFNTLDEGINAAPLGAVVAIHADTYPLPEPPAGPVISKQLRFESYEASALIGVGE